MDDTPVKITVVITNIGLFCINLPARKLQPTQCAQSHRETAYEGPNTSKLS